MNFNAFIEACEADADKHGVKLTAKLKKLLQSDLCDTREDAAPVLKKVHKPGKATPDPIYGLFEAEVGGQTCVVEYEPDTALRDSEQVPLLEEGGIEEFFRREVLPYTPDAWIDHGKTLVGYEISFTRHFYRPVPMRSLDEIKADIYALEQETEGLLEQIVGEAE
jgi:type I restriction enzyme M protein